MAASVAVAGLGVEAVALVHAVGDAVLPDGGLEAGHLGVEVDHLQGGVDLDKVSVGVGVGLLFQVKSCSEISVLKLLGCLQFRNFLAHF